MAHSVQKRLNILLGTNRICSSVSIFRPKAILYVSFGWIDFKIVPITGLTIVRPSLSLSLSLVPSDINVKIKFVDTYSLICI